MDNSQFNQLQNLQSTQYLFTENDGTKTFHISSNTEKIQFHPRPIANTQCSENIYINPNSQAYPQSVICSDLRYNANNPENSLPSNTYLLPKSSYSNTHNSNRIYQSSSEFAYRSILRHSGSRNSFQNNSVMSSAANFYPGQNYSRHSDTTFNQFIGHTLYKPFDGSVAYDNRCLMVESSFYKKPDYSYASLIAQALNDSPTKKKTLNEIYEFILEKYPYYRSHEGWQNSIRHNLSLHKGFSKSKREQSIPGKGHFWSITPGYEKFYSDGHFKSFKSKSKDILSSDENPEYKSSSPDTSESSSVNTPVSGDNKKPKLKKVSNFTEKDIKELRKNSGSIIGSGNKLDIPSKCTDFDNIQDPADSKKSPIVTKSVLSKRSYCESIESYSTENVNSLLPDSTINNDLNKKFCSKTTSYEKNFCKLRLSKSCDDIEANKNSNIKLHKLDSPKSCLSFNDKETSQPFNSSLLNTDILKMLDIGTISSENNQSSINNYLQPSQIGDFAQNEISSYFDNYLGYAPEISIFDQPIRKFNNFNKDNAISLNAFDNDAFLGLPMNGSIDYFPDTPSQNNSENSGGNSKPDTPYLSSSPSQHTASSNHVSVATINGELLPKDTNLPEPNHDFDTITSFPQLPIDNSDGSFVDESCVSKISDADKPSSSDSTAVPNNSSNILDTSLFSFNLQMNDYDYQNGVPSKKIKSEYSAVSNPTPSFNFTASPSEISNEIFKGNTTFFEPKLQFEASAYSNPFDQIESIFKSGSDNSQSIIKLPLDNNIPPSTLAPKRNDNISSTNQIFGKFDDNQINFNGSSLADDIRNSTSLYNSLFNSQEQFSMLLNDSGNLINFSELGFNCSSYNIN
ncbi:Forkhead box protein L1 [Smittium culicis]|uniref:Forkhead box protein L1 n=1 Tax=Smittium culicis TaxID=133412 RepID=A0A1R1X3C9_9FUNG|nr:Forkhead box protein L1 [Smittium culicis]OMJ14510.1 Forkhead box protein L1 [Smittium culicis]